MKSSVSQFIPWLTPAGIVAAGIVTGYIFKWTYQRYLKGLVVGTRWEGSLPVLRRIARKLPWWGLMIGVFAAMPFVPLIPKYSALIHETAIIITILLGGWTMSVGGGEALLVLTEPTRAQSTSILKILFQAVVWAIAGTIILHSLGIAIAPILTALGVGGLAVALALQDTLSNLFAGLQLILSGQIKVGDFLKLESGEDGYVTDINWRTTTIRALPNNMVVVPNRKLASSVVTNFFAPEREMSVLVPVGVSYKSDLEKVEQVAIEVGREVMNEVEGGVASWEPLIRYYQFGDSSINFNVILRTTEFVGQFLVRHEFIKGLHRRFAEEGIEIPFPQRVVTMNPTEMDAK